jgi:prefoldin beta subunit
MDHALQELMQEVQLLEQQLQHIGMQKQSVALEQAEVQNALKEVRATSGDVYKIVAGIMVKTDKKATITELETKEKQLATRLAGCEKQEQALVKQGEGTRTKMQALIGKQGKKA